MELRAAPAVAAIARRIAAYLARLPVDAATRQRLAAAADDADPARALAGLHGALAADGGEAAARSGAPTPSDAVQSGSRGFTRAGSGDAASATRRSQRRRLELGYGTGVDAASPPRLQCAPPLNRSPMAPRQWSAADGAAADPGSARGRNMRRRRGALRRALLLALVLGQTYLATSLMSAVLPYHGREPLEVAVLLLYAVLFFWISAGFWTAVCGFVVQLRGGDAHAISRSAAADAPLGDGRTAVVMPICSEDVARVFAGLRATCASVAARGELDRFDFYVLSDSADADTRVAELHAWRTLCREPELAGHVFYRWRRHRIKRKSGNVADFCRRWGRNYRYLVVLDADSVMSGDCLLRLVQLMEANPAAGIIQTAPVAAGRDTFYARMQQFATRVYGPLFTAGLHYWQLGESHYWGHNAILRVAPFTRHCALARLPGNGALSGEILSHDFVEAALMRRAGWEVWLAYDLAGSYEEMPPNLIDELKRDRRWCHGNLMNARLFAARGLHPAHRAVFFTGVMAYLSSLLWFAFLLLSTALLAQHTLAEPQYFVAPNQLFPLWPEWRPQWAISLFGATATLLLLPKLLAVALRVVRGARDFGGAARLTTAMLLELLLSAVLAPIRMLFHAQFVAAALLGMRIRWKSPPRDDSETGWLEACRRHGPHTVFGLAWAGFVYWLNPAFLWWLAPVVGAIALSIPISVLSSRVGWGRGLRHAGLFLIPEEVRPPAKLRATAAHVAATPPSPGFVDAVVDPAVNALLCAAARPRPNGDAARSAARAARARATGPDGLDSGARAALLDDPEALALLHFQVWSAPAPHPGWLAAMGETGADFFPTPSGADDAQTPLPARQRGPGRRRAAPAA